MPYLTPETTPSASVRRCLFIPDDPRWLAAFNGAILELTFAYNWEQETGTIPVDDAAEVAAIVFENYLKGECDVIGEIKAVVGFDAVPSNCLILEGQTLAQADYPKLYAVIPAAWKSGNMFTLPTMVKRTLIGSDPLNPQTPPIAGSEGGEATHTLTIAEMPTHHHAPQAGWSNFTGFAAGDSTATLAAGTTHKGATVTGDTGGGGAHNNMPPYLAVIWVIVAR